MRCRIFGYACVHQSHTLKLSLLALELDSVAVVAPPVWAAILLIVLSSISPIPVADSVMLVTSLFLAALMTAWAAGTVVVTLSGAATVPT